MRTWKKSTKNSRLCINATLGHYRLRLKRIRASVTVHREPYCGDSVVREHGNPKIVSIAKSDFRHNASFILPANCLARRYAARARCRSVATPFALESTGP